MHRQGIRLLKLTLADSSIAYVALPLDNYAELHAFVEKHAGSDHVLSHWLKTADPF
jgi:hypothetical protein